MLLICNHLGFPKGFAATSRAELLARALSDAGARVTVLCTTVSEMPGRVRNRAPRGVQKGVEFEYTTGTTIRSRWFLVRRIVYLRGVALAIARMRQARQEDGQAYALLLISANSWSLAGATLRLAAWLLRVPLFVEICERPWSMRDHPSIVERWDSPLRGATGAVCISSFLVEWSRAEAARLGLRTTSLFVPILVDAAEFQTSQPTRPDPFVLYAASSGYDESTVFVARAMAEVWKAFPQCRLLVTGFEERQARRQLAAAGLSDTDIRIRCSLLGYVAKRELIELYGSASALLATLHDDVRSQARFPTKIAEYLASGRPVVTRAVGEVGRFLENGVSAFMAQNDTPVDFAAAIVRALSDDERASQVGLAGRDIGLDRFDYRQYGPLLLSFFASSS